MFAMIDLMAKAAADAARAEMLFEDGSLRDGQDRLRTFRVTTLPSYAGRDRRPMPVSWKLRLDPLRARPVL